MEQSEPESSGSPPPYRHPAVRWLLLVLAFVATGYLLLIGGLHWYVDADYVEGKVNPPLADATDGAYRSDVGEVAWGFNPRSVHLEKVTVAPDLEAVAANREDASRSGRRVRASVSDLQFTGIHLWSLLWQRQLAFDEIALLRPVLRAEIPASGQTDGPAADSVRATPAQSSSQIGLLSGIETERVRVEEGTLSVERGADAPRDSLWGLSAELGRLSADSVMASDLVPLLADRLVEGRFDGYSRLMPGEMYELQLGPGRASSVDSTVVVQGPRFAPTVSDEEFMRQHTYRTNRFQASVERLAIDGIDLRQFVEDGDVRARTIRIDTMDLEVYRDNHLPEREGEPPPPTPHEAIQSLETALHVDTIRVASSRIKYVKRPEEGPITGELTFAELWSTVYNLSNHPDRQTASSPAVLDFQTKVAGEAPLDATIRLPLLSPNLSLSFEGRVGSMDPTILNDVFVPLGGVRIQQGELDSLWFAATVEDGRATGTVEGVYRNLNVQLLEKGTGKRNLASRVKSFVVDDLVLRRTNQPGDGPLATGQIDYTYTGENSFFKYLWLSLRSGIYSLVGIDRVPGGG